MSAKRTERLLNLTICLMAARRPLSRAQIREAVADYRSNASDEAFERMFERDKDTLREMGIPVVVESADAYFDDEVGYRIDPNAYALPEIEVGPDELAVLTVAARAWKQAALAPAATAALRKLAAYGPGESTTVDPDRLGIEPRVATAEAAFAPLYEAARDGRPVEFGYRTPSSPEVLDRHVEPWGVVSWRGRWYLVGHDTDRAATRVFRLSRIVGQVRATGPAGSVQVPDDADPQQAIGMIGPTETDRTAIVLVPTDEAQALRRTALDARPADDGSGDVLTLPMHDPESLAADVVEAEAVALEPAELREACVRRVRALVAAHPGETAR